ncbi:glycerol-3-phosphate dehydrogenase/oxidase [Porphyromonadaceae bacterium]
MNRDSQYKKLESITDPFDFVIIGGGATGLGIAVDAATRGYSVALFEQHDFAKGTSSRSTKLVHGGVRYLEKGDIALVLEALYERGLIARNAPHIFKNQKFLIPCYRWYESAMYTIGLTMYDLLAGRLSLGRSAFITKKKALRLIPPLKQKGLSGGVIYHDGQFDDSRLAINLAQTAIEAGAIVANYTKVIDLIKINNKIAGVRICDQLTGRTREVMATVVVNAAGVFADDIHQMNKPGQPLTIKPSQGVHCILDRSFIEGDTALMIPKTSDGRVLFAVPWHDKIVVGTTDTVIENHSLEPKALEEEIDFILATAGNYLSKPPKRSDVQSVFAGLRPLAAPKGEGKKTKEISRSHKVMCDKSGLISIIGGKWTTYRKMAQDTINVALKHFPQLPKKECVTKRHLIHGAKTNPDYNNPIYVYGSDIAAIEQLINSNPEMAKLLHPNYGHTVGEVVWVVRNEMAMTVEDVLARRMRLLFLDARVAIEAAPIVAEILAKELGKSDEWQSEQLNEFRSIASSYLLG